MSPDAWTQWKAVLLQDLGKGTRMIAVLVRDDDQVYRAQIDAEGLDVVEEDLGLGPCIEEDRLLGALDEAGETPVGLRSGRERRVVVEDRDRDLSLSTYGTSGKDSGQEKQTHDQYELLPHDPLLMR